VIAAVVLCGGTSRRMGGVDKTAADLAGRSVLDTLLDSLPADWAVICVGEPRDVNRDVVWAREDPPLGGPVAGLAAGVSAALPDANVIVAFAGDQPFAGSTGRDCAAALVDAPADLDGVAARQEDGRLQLLLAAYRRKALTRVLEVAPPDSGVYKALASLQVSGVGAEAHATLDVDTPDDLDDARRRATP
jgi:molybdenum cofactor guanylyltransferase